MERIVSNGYRDCTALLDGTECKVVFDHCYRAFAVMNDSTEDVFVSIEQGKSSGEDGVRRIAPGCSSVLAHMRTDIDTVYVTGSGSVQIAAQNGTENPFKPQSGGGDLTINGNVVTPSATNGNIRVDGVEVEVYDDTEVLNSAKEYADSVASNPNLLINPDLKINQRGQTEYTSVGYTADRWYMAYLNKAEITENGIKVHNINARANNAWMIQRIEFLPAGTYTLTVKLRKSRADLALRVWTSGTKNTTEWQTVTAKITTTADRSDYQMQMATTDSGALIDDWVEIAWAKLELGSIATPFIPPDPATELVKCQRYYQIYTSGDINPVELRPNMRIVPTITQLSNGNYAYNAEIY